jgi:hypothetical protein
MNKAIVSEWILLFGRESARVQEVLEREHWYDYPPYMFSRAIEHGWIYYCNEAGITVPAYTKDYCRLSDKALELVA